MGSDTATILILVAVIGVVIFMVYKFTTNKASENLLGDYTIDDKYNNDKVLREKEMDRILDKIGKSGVNSLSRSEKEFLDKHAQK